MTTPKVSDYVGYSTQRTRGTLAECAGQFMIAIYTTIFITFCTETFCVRVTKANMDDPREGLNAEFREYDDIRRRQEQAEKLGTTKDRDAALQADSSKIQTNTLQNTLHFVH